jgi:1-acyl-sn-glycerol-3-phosphate acyltransferase
MAALVDDIREVARGWRWSRRPLTPRSAEPWMPERERREYPTEWARTKPARAARELILRYGFRPIVWTETDPVVEGLDRLDGLHPPVLFVANHASHIDTPLLLCSLPREWRRRTAVAAAADYFFDVKWRAATTALMFNTFPVYRTGGPKATTTARLLIEDGWNLVVFPEGTRSKDGWMSRWRHGAARLCIDHAIPAVPVALRGTFAAMPRGKSWPVKGRVPMSVRFGPALFPDPDEDFGSFSRRMQQALGRLADEDATTWWESLRREADGATPKLTGPDAPTWRRIWEGSRPPPRRRPPRVWQR